MGSQDENPRGAITKEYFAISSQPSAFSFFPDLELRTGGFGLLVIPQSTIVNRKSAIMR